MTVCALCDASKGSCNERGTWKSNLVYKLAEKERNRFITNLANKTNIQRAAVSDYVFNYHEKYICRINNRIIFSLLKKYSKREKECVIHGCKRRNCRVLKVPMDENCEEYHRLTDAFASILMTRGEVSGIRHFNDDDVDIEKLRGKPICSSHRWILTRGEEQVDHLVRPVSEHGICTLQTLAERQTMVWVKKQIFKSDVMVSGNVMFTSEVYGHYKDLCNASCKKPENERYVIGKHADALAMFRIFMKTGR